MAPQHPVPKGYGPLGEAQIVRQGTGGRIAINPYEDEGELSVEELGGHRRHACELDDLIGIMTNEDY